MFVVYQSLKRPRYTLEAAHSPEMPAQTRSCDIPHNLNPKPNSRYYDFICIFLCMDLCTAEFTVWEMLSQLFSCRGIDRKCMYIV